ncbi:MAG TPA: flagellar hook-length control protein FliK [Bacilli bacterium]
MAQTVLFTPVMQTSGTGAKTAASASGAMRVGTGENGKSAFSQLLANAADNGQEDNGIADDLLAALLLAGIDPQAIAQLFAASNNEQFKQLAADMLQQLSPQFANNPALLAAGNELLLNGPQSPLPLANRPAALANQTAESVAATDAAAKSGFRQVAIDLILNLLRFATQAQPQTSAGALPQTPVTQPLPDAAQQLFGQLSLAISGMALPKRKLLSLLPAELNRLADELSQMLQSAAGQAAGVLDKAMANPSLSKPLQQLSAQVLAALQTYAASAKQPVAQIVHAAKPQSDQPEAGTANGSQAAMLPPSGPLILTNHLSAPPNFANSTNGTLNMNNFSQEFTQFVLKSMEIKQFPDFSQAKLSLIPEHLGKIDVQMTMQNGQLVAQFIAEHAHAKEMLENQLPQLRLSLQSQGVQVDRLEVLQTSASASQLFYEQSRQGFSHQQHDRQRKKMVNGLVAAVEAAYPAWEEPDTAAAYAYGSSFNATA